MQNDLLHLDDDRVLDEYHNLLEDNF
jgi:hypothetical protein